MAIVELQRTQQKRFTGNNYESQATFQMPIGKNCMKVGLRIHPIDYTTAGLSIRYRIMALRNGEWRHKAGAKWESTGDTVVNKHGITNPNPFIRFTCRSLENTGYKVEAQSNGARFRIVVGGMTVEEWGKDSDKGDEV